MSRSHPTTSSLRVLVVDDEPMVREVIGNYLRDDGFAITEAATGSEAITAIDEDDHDLIVLDLMLPALSGWDVLRYLRRTSSTPVIVLTARGEEMDRVHGLELGADDYVVKPFSPREITARVRSVLRRSRSELHHEILSFDDTTIDTATMTVERNDQPVELTRKEYDLLVYLAHHPNRVISRAELLTEVWGSSEDWQDPATVTVHIARLRRKLENNPTHPQHIITVFGIGYRFVS